MKRIRLFILAIVAIAGLQTTANALDIDSLKQEIVARSKEIHELQKDSLILSKLSPAQLMEVKNKELEVKKLQIENQGREDMPLNGFGIFMICLLPFLFVAVILFIQARTRNRESVRRYDLYMKSLEMGQPVPEHFFDEPKKANPASNLKKGILWLAVGLAITISFAIVNEKDALFLGIVPAFVGAGYLLVHLLDKPKTELPAGNDEQRG